MWPFLLWSDIQNVKRLYTFKKWINVNMMIKVISVSSFSAIVHQYHDHKYQTYLWETRDITNWLLKLTALGRCLETLRLQVGSGSRTHVNGVSLIVRSHLGRCLETLTLQMGSGYRTHVNNLFIVTAAMLDDWGDYFI